MAGQRFFLLKYALHVREEAVDIAIMYLHYCSSWMIIYVLSNNIKDIPSDAIFTRLPQFMLQYPSKSAFFYID